MIKTFLKSDLLMKLCVITLMLLYAWSAYDNVQASSTDYRITGLHQTVTVSQGDTVWSIAAKHVGAKEDVRNLVVAIKQANGLENEVRIYPGQTLKIPVKQTTTSPTYAKK